MSTYIVQKGDKIQGLADTWGTTLPGIYEANPGLKPVVAKRIREHGYSLQTGELLTVPDNDVGLNNSVAVRLAETGSSSTAAAQPTPAAFTATICAKTHTLRASATRDNHGSLNGDLSTGPAPCVLTVPGVSPPQTSSMEVCIGGYYMGTGILDGNITLEYGTDGKCVVPSSKP